MNLAFLSAMVLGLSSTPNAHTDASSKATPADTGESLLSGSNLGRTGSASADQANAFDKNPTDRLRSLPDKRLVEFLNAYDLDAVPPELRPDAWRELSTIATRHNLQVRLAAIQVVSDTEWLKGMLFPDYGPWLWKNLTDKDSDVRFSSEEAIIKLMEVVPRSYVASLLKDKAPEKRVIGVRLRASSLVSDPKELFGALGDVSDRVVTAALNNVDLNAVPEEKRDELFYSFARMTRSKNLDLRFSLVRCLGRVQWDPAKIDDFLKYIAVYDASPEVRLSSLEVLLSRKEAKG